MAEHAGREIPKEYRDIVNYQVEHLGWRYDNGGGRGGHPCLYPTDRTQRPIAISTTPTSHPRALKNFTAQIRRAGGQWPPEGSQR
ncbi:hypothetical protein [Amycolatopsis sp. CFH S0078]|uniref:hypothetical protein n=1 Tax=Amycolatopsis sp. CFH S0078 TaxID=1644108 RepID=UPI00106F00E9|nr:hypothetical protein [Amycolatopsis sp. CFH S0078]